MGKNRPTLEIELSYPALIVAGVDEAGRGPLAGPVVAASVIINQDKLIDEINDSKKLSKKSLQLLYQQIINFYDFGVGIVEVEKIEKYNILEATKLACEIAVKQLNTAPNIVIVDGNMKFADNRFVSMIKGDALSISIAAASIVAKVTRDMIMNKLSVDFPEYLWHKNFGYGTKEHISAIKKYGISPHHRKSFLTNIL